MGKVIRMRGRGTAPHPVKPQAALATNETTLTRAEVMKKGARFRCASLLDWTIRRLGVAAAVKMLEICKQMSCEAYAHGTYVEQAVGLCLKHCENMDDVVATSYILQAARHDEDAVEEALREALFVRVCSAPQELIETALGAVPQFRLPHTFDQAVLSLRAALLAA